MDWWFLRTLILLKSFSTFNTFTHSVPIPKTSLGRISNLLKLPSILKYVVRPVAPAELIPTFNLNLLVVTPIAFAELLSKVPVAETTKFEEKAFHC